MDRGLLARAERSHPGLYNGGMQRSAAAREAIAPDEIHLSRAQALADAEGLLRAEGLETSPEHKALAARWAAGEIDTEEFKRLNWEQVRERAAVPASR